MSEFIQESEGQSQDERELQRYHKLFKNYRQIKNSIQRQNQQKQSSKKSVGSVQQAIQIEQQRNLETRIAFTQKQYAKARENNILLLKKLSEAQEQNQFLKFQLDRLKRQKDEQAYNLKQQLGRTRKEHLMTKQKYQLQEKQRQTVELLELRQKLQYKQKQISRLHLKIKSLELDKKNHQNQIKNLNNINQIFKKKINQLQSNINDVYLGEESKGAQLLQLDQAKQAVERLVLILRNTEEYKKFGNFAQDFKEIHYLKNITKRLRSNSLSQSTDRKRSCSVTQFKIDQRLLWTPASCYKILLQIKLKYQEMSQECIQEILFELNQIWLSRQEAHVARISESYQNEITRLKKKTQERYDELVARKQIQRLKKELQDVKLSKKGNGSTTQNLDLLKNIGQYEDELRLRQREIKLLQDRIRLMQTENSNYDKVLYLQGALWIIDKILDQIEENNQEVRQFEDRFRQNSHNFSSNQEWISAFKQFFEAIGQINTSLSEKIMIMKDSTLKKMGNQRGNNRDSAPIQNSRKI